MLTFVVRRFLLAVPVLLGVVFVVMLTVDLLPGDAVTLMLGEHATKDAVAALREHLGLDKPFLVRYLDYVGLGEATRDRLYLRRSSVPTVSCFRGHKPLPERIPDQSGLIAQANFSHEVRPMALGSAGADG